MILTKCFWRRLVASKLPGGGGGLKDIEIISMRIALYHLSRSVTKPSILHMSPSMTKIGMEVRPV